MLRTVLFILLTLSFVPIRAAKLALEVVLPHEPRRTQFNVVDDNFIGISFELSSFDTLWGRNTQAIPAAIQNYLHNIQARLTSPLRIRIGGNGMDGSTYNQDLTNTMLILTDPDAYFNDIPVDFGPVFFDVLNAMYDKVGPMQYTIGLSMRDPDNYDNSVLLASDAKRMLGSKLDAVLLGNEPDLYAGHGKRDAYNISAYIPEVGDLIGQLAGANLLEEKLIGGPTICCTWDLEDVIDAGYDKYPFKYYTMQHYPQNICGGANTKNTNISFFLSHANVGQYVHWNQNGIDRAKELGVPVLLTEYNTVSCGGSNVSSTFAATLWAVDAGLKFATANFSAVYLHTREYDVQYNLFDPPAPDRSTDTNWRTGSVYYSALFLAEATSRYGSVIIDLDIDNSSTSSKSTVAAYGIYDDGGHIQGKLVLINYDNDEPQQFKIPPNLSDAIEYRLLIASDVKERTNISWAGQTVGENGILNGDQATISLDCTKGCTVEVPSPGAALVVLHPENGDSFFRGNSTIAPWPSASSSALVVQMSHHLLVALLSTLALCLVSW